jgi:hypothetical protein
VQFAKKKENRTLFVTPGLREDAGQPEAVFTADIRPDRANTSGRKKHRYEAPLLNLAIATAWSRRLQATKPPRWAARVVSE